MQGMKKIFSVLMALVVSASVLCSCGSKPKKEEAEDMSTGLRDIQWEMTREQVRKLEKAEFVGYDDNFIRFYDTDVSQPIVELGVYTNNNVDLWYYFNNEDRLFKIEYRLAASKLTDNSYKNVKDMMNDKFGKPYKEDEVDSEDEFVKVTSWKSGKSDIKLSFKNNPDKSLKTMYVTYLPNK